MEDFKDTSNAEENFNVKRHYRLSRGKEISRDFFFYTCFEEEQTLKQLADEYPDAPKRFPLAIQIEKKAKAFEEEYTNKSIENLIEELCQWYASHQEILVKNAILDYELHAKLLYPFVFLIHDLYVVYEWKLENRLPRIDADGELDENWKTIELNFEKFFPNFAKFFFSYMKWCNQGNRQKTIDLASIPPVGRYISLLRKARSNIREEKPAIPKNNFKKPEHEEISEASQQEIDEAMKEVEESISKLNDNPELLNLTLIPRNSFIRRKQHKMVTDLGLTSTSVGEGQDRAIQILR